MIFLLTRVHQVGAGPSGLAAALALLKNSIPVRIIEKDAQMVGEGEHQTVGDLRSTIDILKACLSFFV